MSLPFSLRNPSRKRLPPKKAAPGQTWTARCNASHRYGPPSIGRSARLSVAVAIHHLLFKFKIPSREVLLFILKPTAAHPAGPAALPVCAGKRDAGAGVRKHYSLYRRTTLYLGACGSCCSTNFSRMRVNSSPSRPRVSCTTRREPSRISSLGMGYTL